jgi:hypothetical protein
MDLRVVLSRTTINGQGWLFLGVLGSPLGIEDIPDGKVGQRFLAELARGVLKLDSLRNRRDFKGSSISVNLRLKPK